MKKLLIVEDDRWLADIYRDVLSVSFAVTISHDAQSAAETLEASIPDIIILDIMMPGGNGFAFLQEIRSYNDTVRVPVVLCSGVNLSSSQRAAATHFEPVIIIDKADLTPEKLIEVVNETRLKYAHKQ